MTINSIPAEGGARRMLPWTLVALLSVALGGVLYKQFDMAISLDHARQRLKLVTTQRNMMKLLIDSHASSFTRETIAQVLKTHPELTSFPKDDDNELVVNQVPLKFEGARLKSVELLD
jgi:hypothetical protein